MSKQTALINKGWPGLLRQELVTYEMYAGTVSRSTVTRTFGDEGRFYETQMEFSFHEGGTGWDSSLQNTMLLEKASKEHLVKSDFKGQIIDKTEFEPKEYDAYQDEIRNAAQKNRAGNDDE